MATGFDTQLDAPPPSPAQPSLGQMAGPMGSGMPAIPGGGPSSIPGSQPMGGGMAGNAPLSQPMAQAIVDGGTQVALMLQDFARATPRHAHLLDPVLQGLQAYLGAVTAEGTAGPTGPTAAGSPFPGGGFGRGPMPT